jgi:hypothetical protein
MRRHLFVLAAGLLSLTVVLAAQEDLDSDTFVYSNGLLATVSAGKWTNLSGKNTITVASNLITPTTDNTESAAVITTWTGTTQDQYSKIRYRGSGEGGPTIRSNATADFIWADFVPGDAVYVFECVGGTLNQIGGTLAFDTSIAFDDVLYVEIQGSTITVKQNGVSLGTRTATGAVASGKPGVQLYGMDADQWVAGDFGGEDPPGEPSGGGGRRMLLMGVGEWLHELR